MLAHPMAIGLTLRLADRFGDHGLVSVILAVKDPEAGPDAMRIDTWLMSCRVIARTAEEFFFNCLLAEAQQRGTRRLVGHYIPTAKNGLVKDLYDRLGFAVKDTASNGARAYELDLEKAAPAKTFIQRK
jgi:FkbH-like protein